MTLSKLKICTIIVFILSIVFIHLPGEVAEASVNSSAINIAIMNFANPENKKDAKFSGYAADRLEHYLLQRTNFSIIDRRQIDYALGEIRLSQSGLIDEATTKKIGKFLSADVIFVGAVACILRARTEFDNRGGYYAFYYRADINLKALHVETGCVLYNGRWWADVQDKSRDVPSAESYLKSRIDECIDKLSEDFSNKFNNIDLNSFLKRRDTKRIAILGLENKSEWMMAGEYASNRLERHLIEESNFMILDRSKIENAIKELKLNMTGLIDTRYIKEIGKFIAADYLVIGNISGEDMMSERNERRGTERFVSRWEVNIRAIEVETGRIVFSNGVSASEKGSSDKFYRPAYIRNQIYSRVKIDECINNLSHQLISSFLK